MKIADIWHASPLAVVGVIACGLGQSAFFALGVVFGLAMGLPLFWVSIMMALPPFGVILSQYPIGWVSDRIDRRTIIMTLSLAAAIVPVLILAGGYYVSWFMLIGLMTLFGIVSLPVYSLVIAHANDHLRKEQVLGASAKLVLLYGVGSIVGPILAGTLMSEIGKAGFLIFMVLVNGSLAGFAFWRNLRQPEHIKAHGRDVISVSPVSTPANAPLLHD